CNRMAPTKTADTTVAAVPALSPDRVAQTGSSDTVEPSYIANRITISTVGFMRRIMVMGCEPASAAWPSPPRTASSGSMAATSMIAQAMKGGQPATPVSDSTAGPTAKPADSDAV